MDLIKLTADYVLSLAPTRENKHIKKIDDLFEKSNPNYSWAKSCFKFYYGEFRGTIKKTHRNFLFADFVYGETLKLESWYKRIKQIKYIFLMLLLAQKSKKLNLDFLNLIP